jgi:Cytochrome C oxidase, cbb3-type, subunit III
MRRSVVAMSGGISQPPRFTDEMVRDGFDHYEDMCAGCHGGPGIERSEIGKGLNPQAPDFADAVPAWSPSHLFWIVKKPAASRASRFDCRELTRSHQREAIS